MDDRLQHAIARQDRGDFQGAIQLLQGLLADHVQSVETHSRLGWLLWRVGRLDEALSQHRTALGLAPESAAAWVNYALALRDRGDHDGVLQALQRAIALDSGIAEAHVNLGIEWLARGLPSRAVTAQRQALSLAPAMAEARINLALALQELGDLDATLGTYDRALQYHPGDPRILSNRMVAMQYCAGASAQDLRAAAEASGRFFGTPQHLPRRPRKNGADRIRVGYVSGDFYAHPVGWLGCRVWSQHDRTRFEIHAFADVIQRDFITESIHHDMEYWHETQGLSDADLRHLILSQEIDVLVDLSGHTANNRLGVFAPRSAPRQFSWLGYSASTGLAAMDGVLLGADQAPEGTEAFFAERVIRLPRCGFCYLPPDYAPPVASAPCLRNGYLTLGCFNNPAKLNEQVLRVWAEIMVRLPDSHLILKWRSLLDPEQIQRVRLPFLQRGIAPERLSLRGASTHPEMLTEYGEIDLALDPFPFGGGLSSCEALWMGVPVVTLPWRRPMSRQGLTILKALGLNEFIADSPQGYIELVTRLGQSRESVIQFRQTLRARFQASELFEGASLARALENIFLKHVDTSQSA